MVRKLLVLYKLHPAQPPRNMGKDREHKDKDKEHKDKEHKDKDKKKDKKDKKKDRSHKEKSSHSSRHKHEKSRHRTTSDNSDDELGGRHKHRHHSPKDSDRS